MKTIKVSLTCILYTLISACDFHEETNSPKLKITPEIQQQLDHFQKQKHRFEFSGCSFKYNDKEFNLNTPIDKVIEILGPYEKRTNASDQETSYTWINKKISIFSNNSSKTISSLEVRLFVLEKLGKQTKETDFYILIEGVPIDSKTTMGNFVNTSHFSFNDFLINNHGYEYINSNCPTPVSYLFISDVNFSYIGNGHVRIKDKPDFETTYPVDFFHISAHE